MSVTGWIIKAAVVGALAHAGGNAITKTVDHGGLGAVAKNISQGVAQVFEPGAFNLPAAGRLEVAFSPNEGSESLVVKVIDSAKRDIKVMAYSFTSAPVVSALAQAQHRGVKVSVVADQKSNVSEDRSGKARAALSALVNAGADVRTISVYPIAHDKVIIVDGNTVELGSYNYSAAAAKSNSENVLVNWDNPALAEVYTRHFERNQRQAVAYRMNY